MTDIAMPKQLALTPVQEFYKGQSVLVTGGTGFMGKVLIEKLLFSCPDISEVYILMRPKRGKGPEARLDDMFKLPIFQRIHNERPEVLKKLIPVQGDVTIEGLGLSSDSRRILCERITVVFHMAATLKLEANLKEAIDMNLAGTRRVIELCLEMPNLISVVHLSTAFCYCDQEVLLEKVYDCAHKPDDLIRCVEWMDVKTIDKITADLLKPHPNTYLYSKRLAEQLVRDEYPRLPICIARPSIVTPSLVEPVPGWVDNLNGPIGLMVGGAKGVIRSMLCNGAYRSEIVPVDIAVNGLIAIAWQIATMAEKPKNIPVYNVTCCESKKLTWNQILENGRRLCYEYPFEAGLWYPNGVLTTSPIVHNINVALFHWLPAYVIDFLLLCFGQKRFMRRVQEKISAGLEVLQFFTMQKWDFRSERFFGVFQSMTPRDKAIFNMDIEDTDTNDYLKQIILGGRQYCMKEPLSTLPKARMQLKILYFVDRFSKLLIFGLFLWLLYTLTGAERWFKTDSLVSIKH